MWQPTEFWQSAADQLTRPYNDLIYWASRIVCVFLFQVLMATDAGGGRGKELIGSWGHLRVVK